MKKTNSIKEREINKKESKNLEGELFILIKILVKIIDCY